MTLHHPFPQQGQGCASSEADVSACLSPNQLLQRLSAQPESTTSQAAGFSSPGRPVVIDLRARRLFTRGHLPASHSIPAGLLLAGEWPEGDLVLVNGGDGEASRVREAVHEAGYPRQLLQLAGGFPAWQAERLPVSRSGPWAPWSQLLQGCFRATPPGPVPRSRKPSIC